MNKIDRKASEAFVHGYYYKNSNTVALSQMQRIDGESVRVRSLMLYGRKIAHMNLRSGLFVVTLAGKNTATTRRRLNSLLEYMNSISFIEDSRRYRVRSGKLLFGCEETTPQSVEVVKLMSPSPPTPDTSPRIFPTIDQWMTTVTY